MKAIRYFLITILSLLELLLLVAFNYNFFNPHTKGFSDFERTFVGVILLFNTVLLAVVIKYVGRNRKKTQ